MKELLEFIIKNIVKKPEEVEVHEEMQNDITNFRLSVSKDDIGKVIGKNGKVIKAVRSALKIVALKTNQKIYLDVAEANKD
jgi:predicted RNA-binding protein YlqC (UPF0109 family)